MFHVSQSELLPVETLSETWVARIKSDRQRSDPLNSAVAETGERVLQVSTKVVMRLLP